MYQSGIVLFYALWGGASITSFVLMILEMENIAHVLNLPLVMLSVTWNMSLGSQMDKKDHNRKGNKYMVSKVPLILEADNSKNTRYPSE